MSGPAARTWDVLYPADRPVGEHRLEPDDHVLDPAIKRRELPGRAGRGETPHLGERLGLGGVPGRETLVSDRRLERLEGHTALGRGHHVLGVDPDDGVHGRAVEDYRVLDYGLEASLCRGGTCPRYHIDLVLTRETEDL